MAALPPPSWPLASTTGKVTDPWYGYLKAADDTWRPHVHTLTSESTISNPAAHVLPNHGVTVFNHTNAVSTGWILEPPDPGVRKTIVVISAATDGVVSLPSTSHLFRPGNGWKLTFTSSESFKVIDLIGVTTGRFYITSNPGVAVVTTV